MGKLAATNDQQQKEEQRSFAEGDLSEKQKQDLSNQKRAAPGHLPNIFSTSSASTWTGLSIRQSNPKKFDIKLFQATHPLIYCISLGTILNLIKPHITTTQLAWPPPPPSKRRLPHPHLRPHPDFASFRKLHKLYLAEQNEKKLKKIFTQMIFIFTTCLMK